MAEATLTIHLHEATERDERGLAVLEKIVNKDHPIAVAFGVDNIEAWQQNQPFYDHVKYLVTAQNVSVMQRGYRNRCSRPHTIRDPHHENKCSAILKGHMDAGAQRKAIWRGKARIPSMVEKEPVAYCPPNSLYDRMTVQIARDLGYKYFTVPSALPAWPYKVRDICMIIIPQTSLKRFGVGRHAYAHLDHLPELEKKGRLERHLDQKLVPITEVEKEPWLVKRALNRSLLVPANEALHHGYIHLRDAKRAVRYFFRKN